MYSVLAMGPAEDKTMAIKRTIEWTGKTGKPCKVVVELQTSKTHWADGDNIEVACCDLHTIAYFDGRAVGSEIIRKPVVFGGETYPARLGGLVLTVDSLAQIDAALAEVYAAPEWQAKQALIAANRASRRDREAAEKASGLCPRCGSYCYGDCQA